MNVCVHACGCVFFVSCVVRACVFNTCFMRSHSNSAPLGQRWRINAGSTSGETHPAADSNTDGSREGATEGRAINNNNDKNSPGSKARPCCTLWHKHRDVYAVFLVTCRSASQSSATTAALCSDCALNKHADGFESRWRCGGWQATSKLLPALSPYSCFGSAGEIGRASCRERV